MSPERNGKASASAAEGIYGKRLPADLVKRTRVPAVVRAQEARRIKWADLIPDGVPYGEMIANGEFNREDDIWIPVFDENGSTLNRELDGALISLAGYVLPLDVTSEGTTSFVLVPFVGACIHVPPPPPNQLVFVTPKQPWGNGNLWDPVVVTGRLSANEQRTDVAQVGYEILAADVELFSRT